MKRSKPKGKQTKNEPAKPSKVIARRHISDEPMKHSPSFDEAFNRCVFVFPEHGHGHQQCTRMQGHSGAHNCGFYAQRGAKA